MKAVGCLAYNGSDELEKKGEGYCIQDMRQHRPRARLRLLRVGMGNKSTSWSLLRDALQNKAAAKVKSFVEKKKPAVNGKGLLDSALEELSAALTITVKHYYCYYSHSMTIAIAITIIITIPLLLLL